MFFLLFSILSIAVTVQWVLGNAQIQSSLWEKKCKITLEYIEMVTLPTLLPPQARRFRQTSWKRDWHASDCRRKGPWEGEKWDAHNLSSRQTDRRLDTRQLPPSDKDLIF